MFARSAMQGVTLGSSNCTGEQHQKTLRSTAPTVAAGRPCQWIVHYNTAAEWNGGVWAVDTASRVGPFHTRTDCPGHVHHDGARYLRSNGGGSTDRYVGDALACRA